MKERTLRLRMIALAIPIFALIIAGCAQSAVTPVTAPTMQAEAANDGGASEMTAPETEAQVSSDLNAQWKRPVDDGWMKTEMSKHMIVAPADNSDLIGNQAGHTYGKITERDVQLWQHETMKLVVRGSEIFHSADELSSTIAVSCDMCHPDGSNTHPETYPKFQVQMGRVAHLRDMINWCIQQAVKGEKLDPDSPEMRALEAYIYAQRKGTELNYGRR